VALGHRGGCLAQGIGDRDEARETAGGRVGGMNLPDASRTEDGYSKHSINP
jgi:hypothetical protein